MLSLVSQQLAVSTGVSGQGQAELIERWRQRHAYPDALGMWANATGQDARSFAFNAIAQDPRVLHRASRLQAVKMAAQAEDFALALTQAGTSATDTWLAAARFVQQAIEAWHKSLRAYDHRAEVSAGVAAPSVTRAQWHDPWEIAANNFPHVDEATGRLATRVLHELGTHALERAQRPWDHVLALAVLRHAAARLRREVDSAARCEAISDVRAVLSYAEGVGLAPFMVAHSGRGKPAQQALALVNDARTIRDVLGGTQAAACQAAIEFHAFAVFALDHRLIPELPLQEAHEMAAAALRQANRVLEAGSAGLPPLPEGAAAPEVVKLYAGACLPDHPETISAAR